MFCIHPLPAEDERSFNAGERVIDDREIEYVRLEVEFGVAIIRPALISNYEVYTRGLILHSTMDSEGAFTLQP